MAVTVLSTSVLLSVLVMVAAVHISYVQGATRCYANLGCYESGILHALPQEPAHVRTEFRVSCRGRVNDAVVLATDDETTTKNKIEQSCFAVDKPTLFITHGFNDRGDASWLGRMRDAYLDGNGEHNVIAVDWHHGATFPYEQAVANSFLVAGQEARFIRHLELVHGVPPLTIHLVGHSLGAQISGNAGAAVAPSIVARVTGLDPAEPYFDHFNDSQRLDPSDAIFVDAIHTDGETFTGLKGYGSLRPQAHIDFYPNGGVKQPGCTLPDVSDDLLSGFSNPSSGISCSHSRAIDLFTQSLATYADTAATGCMATTLGNNNNSSSSSSSSSSCTLSGHPSCPSWEAFEDGNCTACPDSGCVPMGLGADSNPGVRGKIYLSTAWNYPYCGQDYKVTVHLAENYRRAFGRLFLVFSRKSSGITAVDFSRSNRHYHSRDTESHVITTEPLPDQPFDLRVVFVKGSGLSSLGTSDTVSVDKVDIQAMADPSQRWSFCLDVDRAVAVGGKGSKQTLHAC